MPNKIDINRTNLDIKLTSGKVINMIPQLLKDRGLDAADLLYGARLAPGTAYALVDPDKPPKSIYFAVMARVCEFLDVGPGDILKYIPPE